MILPAAVLGVATFCTTPAQAQATFGDSTPYPVGELANRMDSGDLDGDGHLDLVFANALSLDGSILWGAGDGTFSDEERLTGIGGGIMDVGVADFDGDRDLDLVFLMRHGSAMIALMRNDGTGNFSAPESFGPSRSTFSLSIADLDGDGDQDVAVAAMNLGVDFIAAVFVNDGLGGFSLDVHTFEATTTLYITDLALADVDGDGMTDIVGANLISNRVSLLRNTGGGTFDPSVALTTGVTNPFGIALADFDGDGDPDLALAERASSGPDLLRIALNDGAGGFQPFGVYPLGNLSGSQIVLAALDLADIDADGHIDVVSSDRVFFNAGDATFGRALSLGTGALALATMGVDIDADGDLDVVQASYVHPLFDSFAAVVLNDARRGPGWVSGRLPGNQRSDIPVP